MPAHNHTLPASNLPATLGDPSAVVWANSGGEAAFATTPTNVMAPNAVANVGGSQPHTNMQPFVVLQFIIALVGIFPSRN